MVLSEDRPDHGQQNEMKDKHRTHNTTLKSKTVVQRINDISIMKYILQTSKDDMIRS